MKIKNKISFALILVALLFASIPAHAFLVIDPTKGVGKIFTNISRFAEDVQEGITNLQNKILGNRLLQQGMSAAKYVRDTYNTNVAVMQEYQRIYNQVISTDTFMLAQKTVELTAVNNKIKDLEEELEKTQSSFAATKNSEVALIDGKIKTFEDNNAIYKDQDTEEADSIIASNNAEIIKLNNQKEEVIRQANIEEQGITNGLINEIEQLKYIKESIENDLKRYGLYQLTDFIDDVVILTKSRDQNFIPMDEPLTSVAVDRIKTNRANERDDVSKEVFARTISLKSVLGSKLAGTEANTEFNNSFEEVSSNIITLTLTKVDEIENLILYTELMLLDLKMQTARDLAELTEYQFDQGNRDITAFDLGDYAFEYKKYRENKLKQIPKSVNTLYRNANNVVGDILHADYMINGGAADEAEYLKDVIVDPNNAGAYYGNNNYLDDLEYTVDNTKNNIENTLDRLIHTYGNQ